MTSIPKLLALGCALGIAGCAQSGLGGAGALGPGASALPGLARTGLPQGHGKRGSAVSPAIYLFGGQPDAGHPRVGLANVGSMLYGTTFSGGANNLGAIYSMTTGGTETVMHSFSGTPDGINPDAALTNVNGTLYGTTFGQGAKAGDAGTIFSITPSGTYKVVYSFGTAANDCLEPDSDMIYVASKNALYGTGYTGGADGDGCIFELSLAGKKPKESVLYSFTGSPSSPTYTSGVVFYKNKLYGTTQHGGTNNDGTVYRVTLTGKENIVYSFKGQPDGAVPEASLVVMGNALYGTTYQGGNLECAYAGCGTVFKVTAGGKEKVLYRFTDVASHEDGQSPQSALIATGGSLYGTTPLSTTGSGLVYSVSASGHEGIVYRFQDPISGPAGYPESPFAPLLNLGGNLYGTTVSNSGQTGAGTVFEVP